MFRLVITLEGLEYIRKEVNSKSEAETYILEISEKQKIKRADIMNLETKERKRIF